jgi:hypothetical protein|nr:MAG TPA_asm: hypothetical protein [Caudoviricetes sp.]
MGKVLEGAIYHHYFAGKRSHIDDEDCVPDMTDNIDDALIFTNMYRVRSIAEAMGKLYKARGYEVDICELEFKGSYEV